MKTEGTAGKIPFIELTFEPPVVPSVWDAFNDSFGKQTTPKKTGEHEAVDEEFAQYWGSSLNHYSLCSGRRGSARESVGAPV